jgi:hypothetical protein
MYTASPESELIALQRWQYLQSRKIGEYPEVSIAGDKGNTMVQTALGDQCIGQSGFSACRQSFGAQCPRAVPIAVGCFQEWQHSQQIGDR